MTFAHQILQGVTWHARQIPTRHEFHYPYRFWAVNLTQLADNPLPKVNIGASHVPTWLPQWLKKKMAEKIAATIIDSPSAIAAPLGALSIPSSRLFCYQSIRPLFGQLSNRFSRTTCAIG